ncbi:MAG: heme A synthase [Pseudomonadota bacterium]
MSQKKRSIFEEVDSAKPAEPAGAPAVGSIDRGQQGARGAVRMWLLLLFVLVSVMILVGGMTRLTDSGLSITEWRPITGAVPPLSASAWDTEFEKYQQIDEFKLQNPDMTLAEFKTIYWWEWGHRQLGRVIGLVWAVGFLGFLVTRKIPPGWTGRLLTLGVLGGLQGAIGWWMVASGLVDGRLDVASYRLAIHLGLAFVILGLISWYVLLLGRSTRDLLAARRGKEAKLFSLATGLMHLSFLQILVGALVAGIDAGRSYTDWPLMSGQFFPATAFDLVPIWTNFFENAGLVQFIHRILGYLLLIMAVVAWRRSRRSAHPVSRRAFDWVLVMGFGQVVIGIVTVLHAAPWNIAIIHQLGAIVLWVLIIRARFLAQYPKSQSLRGAVA